MRKLCPSWKVYHGSMGCDPLTASVIALCEVTVNNNYDMNSSNHPISDGWIFRFRREPIPGHELPLVRPSSRTMPVTCWPGAIVVTGFELGQVFVIVFVQTCI